MKGNVARRVGRVIITGPWGARQKAVGSRLVGLPECSAKKQEEKIAISFTKSNLTFSLIYNLRTWQRQDVLNLFFLGASRKCKIPKTCLVLQKNAALVLQTVQLFTED